MWDFLAVNCDNFCIWGSDAPDDPTRTLCTLSYTWDLIKAVGVFASLQWTSKLEGGSRILPGSITNMDKAITLIRPTQAYVIHNLALLSFNTKVLPSVMVIPEPSPLPQTLSHHQGQWYLLPLYEVSFQQISKYPVYCINTQVCF